MTFVWGLLFCYGLLFGWLVGWLAGWLVGWLVGGWVASRPSLGRRSCRWIVGSEVRISVSPYLVGLRQRAECLIDGDDGEF